MGRGGVRQGPPAGAPVPAVPVAPVAPAAPAPPPPQTEVGGDARQMKNPLMFFFLTKIDRKVDL